MSVSVAAPALSRGETAVQDHRSERSQTGFRLMLAGALGLPLSLLWDYSWECSVGIDSFWGAPHVTTYIAIMLAGFGSVCMLGHTPGICVAGLSAPLGAWVTAWGVMMFGAALLFERWWQGAYGLAAGIWHPPQICKTLGFVAVLSGVWLCVQLCAARRREHYSFALAGGSLLLLAGVTTVAASIPNRQHSASFYEIACAIFPMLLVAAATACPKNFPATATAAVFSALGCAMTWLLPLFPAKPLTGPVYNTLTHLMPPTLPLLLIVPAVAVDYLSKWDIWPKAWTGPWMKAGIIGIAFVAVFVPAQWFFSTFLLSDISANWVFAGGGVHWPFFLKISPKARQMFWTTSDDALNEESILAVLLLAAGSARVGLWLGQWVKDLKR